MATKSLRKAAKPPLWPWKGVEGAEGEPPEVLVCRGVQRATASRCSEDCMSRDQRQCQPPSGCQHVVVTKAENQMG